MERKLLYLQSALLAGGVFFSWSALARLFRSFHDLYGTIFKFQDCAVQNPMLTPCFYGSLAFLVAFVWSVALIGKPTLRGQRMLRNLLVFGVCFALVVLGYETAEYLRWIDLGSASVSCAPGAHPLRTPCFGGFLFFAVSASLAIHIVRSSGPAQEKSPAPEERATS